MLSFRFADLLGKLSGKDDEAHLYVDAVSRLASVAKSFLEEANSNSSKPQNFNIKNQVISSVRGVTNNFDPWKLYDSAKAYLQGLDEFDNLSAGSNVFIDELASKTKDFLEHYKRHIIARDYETAFDLMLLSNDIYAYLAGLVIASALSTENLQLADSDDGSELRIYSRERISVANDYVEILSSIVAIYAIASSLLGTDPHDEPLQIEKLESGSLYLKIKGAVKVISVITQIIRRSAKYGAMSHSLSGRIDQLPKSADAIDKILGVREILAKNGANVSEIDSEIESATLKLAKHANALMTRMSDIGLNGEFFDSKEKLLLELDKTEQQKMIGHEKEDDHNGD